MPRYVTIADVDEVPEGTGRGFPIAGRVVAVFLRGGKYYAIDDMCPHMGAPLSEGHVDGETVICPWHVWQFSLVDGRWLDNPKGKLTVRVYPVRVVDDEIQIELPDDPPPGSPASTYSSAQ